MFNIAPTLCCFPSRQRKLGLNTACRKPQLSMGRRDMEGMA